MTDFERALKGYVAAPAGEPKPAAYFFLDEGGNLDFGTSGTKYYTMTCLALLRPFPFEVEMQALKLDIIEHGVLISGFHASEDNEGTRKQAFEIIHQHIGNVLRLDQVVVRKLEITPEKQSPARFYSETLGFLIGQSLSRLDIKDFSQIVLVTDTLPPGKKGGGIEQAIRHVLKAVVGPVARYVVLHRPSTEWTGLQVADYLNWALFRKWEGNDRTWDVKVPSRWARYFVGTDKREFQDHEG